MHCPKCGCQHETLDNFCRNCGNTLTGSPHATNSSLSGNSSFNAGQNNLIMGNNISFNNVKSEPITYVAREKITPLSLRGHPVKVAWVIVSGAFGFLGSIASILSMQVMHYQIYVIFLLVFSSIVLAIGITLHKRRFARFPFSINFESNKSGEIFITRIGGSCPNCDGSLKLREVESEGNKTTIVLCTRNPKHRWNFDPTMLDDLEPQETADMDSPSTS